jgi:hypothetical protein
MYHIDLLFNNSYFNFSICGTQRKVKFSYFLKGTVRAGYEDRLESEPLDRPWLRHQTTMCLKFFFSFEFFIGVQSAQPVKGAQA